MKGVIGSVVSMLIVGTIESQLLVTKSSVGFVALLSPLET